MGSTTDKFVFESADDISIDTSNYRVSLTAPGFFCELTSGFGGVGLQLTVEAESTVGAEQPSFWLRSGSATGGSKVVSFTTREAAEDLVNKIVTKVRATKHGAEGKTLGKQLAEKVLEHVGIAATAVMVCFLGAGAAHVGWTVSAPVAANFSDREDLAVVRIEQELQRQYIESALNSRAVYKTSITEAKAQLLPPADFNEIPTQEVASESNSGLERLLGDLPASDRVTNALGISPNDQDYKKAVEEYIRQVEGSAPVAAAADPK